MNHRTSPAGTAESPNGRGQLLFSLSVQDKGSPENGSTVPSGLWVLATQSHPSKGGLFSNLPPGDRCGLFSNLLSGRCESQNLIGTGVWTYWLPSSRGGRFERVGYSRISSPGDVSRKPHRLQQHAAGKCPHSKHPSRVSLPARTRKWFHRKQRGTFLNAGHQLRTKTP